MRGEILFRAPFGKKLFVLPWILSRQGRFVTVSELLALGGIPAAPDLQGPVKPSGDTRSDMPAPAGR